MDVVAVPALQDNYMYLLIDRETRQAAAVDPVDAGAMAEALSLHQGQLKMILTTHHHYDHAHGNEEMQSMFANLIVYGGDKRVQALTQLVGHGDTIQLGALRIECLATPCHTSEHICYHVTAPANQSGPGAVGAVFTGDTLFVAGCGRFFEGTAEQMGYSLNSVLASLPDETRVYCGHEYTVNNLKFALSVEPQNRAIKDKLSWALARRAQGQPTVPSSIGEEKGINPFMRIQEPQVRRFTGESEDAEVMSALRHLKNEFQP